MGNRDRVGRNGFMQPYIIEAAGLKPKRWLLPVLPLFSAIIFSLFILTHPGFAETYVSGDVTSNATWTLAGSPYIITGDITVYHTSRSSGEYFRKLTIEPGVEVRFDPGTGLYIGKDYSGSYGYYGALDAQGTEIAPIVFTSNAAIPSSGDWKGIYFSNPTKDDLTLLDNCVVEYGGSMELNKSNLYCSGSSPTIKNSTIRYGGGSGIFLVSSTPTIECNLIGENDGNGIYADGNSGPLIKDNTLSYNGGVAIYILSANNVRRVNGNLGSGNGQDCIKVRGGDITTTGTWSLQAFPYIVTGDITVYHTSRSNGEYVQKLTIDPGVEVRFDPGTGLYIGKDYSGSYGYYGALDAQGTELAPSCQYMYQGIVPVESAGTQVPETARIVSRSGVGTLPPPAPGLCRHFPISSPTT